MFWEVWLGREKLLFREQILKLVSSMLVAASLGLGMRLVTELTVLELAYAECGRGTVMTT